MKEKYRIIIIIIIIMSQCIIPNWNLRHQRQEQLEGEESKRSSHVHKQLQNPSATQLVPMSSYEVAELTWENGQLAMHGLGGLLHSGQTKARGGGTSETLESIVNQATCHKRNLNLHQHEQQTPIVPSIEAKWASEGTSSGQVAPSLLVKKHTRSDSKQCPRNPNGSSQEEHVDRSACASANATFCRNNDASAMRTLPSLESPARSFKTKTTDEDSDCHGVSENQEDHLETKTETVRSQSSRKSRAAAIHNQSERRRRDRINQKMKALQKLVPNASKTDKASMLDEVIKYLKQLQAQVQMMSSVRNMPQMMIPLGMQQLQMSLLARMGMGVGLGMGMGMLDMSTVARTPPLIHPSQLAAASPAFVPPQFAVSPMFPTHGPAPSNPGSATNGSVPLPEPYTAFLAQSMNMELYNKMEALYQQQANQTAQATTSQPMQSNYVRGN